MSRRLCVLVAWFCLAALGGEPLRLWIFSDTQPGSAGGWRQAGSPFDALDKMFAMARRTGVDAILGVGDIASHNDAAIYDECRQVFEHHFGRSADPPEWLLVMGNHDFYGGKGRTQAQLKRIFQEHLKLRSIDPHVVLKGIDVIGVSLDGGLTPSRENTRFLESALERAVMRDATKPIIVFAHNPVPGTVAGWGDPNAIGEVLRRYPQVVYFSGHTHFPVEDERCIHQKDFTSVATSTMCWTYIEARNATPSLGYGGRSLGKNALYVTIDDQEIVIRRYQMRDRTEILDRGRPWILKLPLTRRSFRYTPERRWADCPRTPPEFPEGAVLKAEPLLNQAGEMRAVRISGPAARHEDLVYSYTVDVHVRGGDGRWTPCREVRLYTGKQGFALRPGRLVFYGDFYMGLNFRKPGFSVEIPVFPPKSADRQGFPFQPGRTYRLEVRAAESFGKTSPVPLTAQVTIPDRTVRE